MGLKFKIKATEFEIEDIAAVASWLLSKLRERVLKGAAPVESVTIVDSAHAKLPSYLIDLIDAQKDRDPDINIDLISKEIAEISVQRAVKLYSGFWDVGKIDFIPNDIDDDDTITLSIPDEIANIKKLEREIMRESDQMDNEKKELGRMLHAVLSPEFNRMHLKMSNIDDKISLMRPDTNKIHSVDLLLRKIAKKLGVDE